MPSFSAAEWEQFQHIIDELKAGDYDLEAPDGETAPWAAALYDLAQALQRRSRQGALLDAMIQRANAGLMLEDILQSVYDEFRVVIPYERIGVALLDERRERVVSRWAQSERSPILLGVGYSAPIIGSSLEQVLHSREPRILNDLAAYLAAKPTSHATRLIVQEGFRSSLTCPLIIENKPVGFIFFSSREPGTYAALHEEVFLQIAGQLSVILERGQLASRLNAQNAALETQNAELQRRNDLRNKMMGIAAHDLRSPLSYILTTAGLLTGPDALHYAAEQPFLISSMTRQARHMLRLVNDLLDFSEIEAGRLQLQPQWLKMARVVEEALHIYAAAAQQKSITLKVDRLDAGDIWADPVRLRQIIENLVSNALKYSPAGSQVKLAAAQETEHWRISVADRGPGIAPADRERLFQPFVRLSALPTGGEKSTGLGLAITHTYVQAHGGEIGVESEPGRGSTFWFTVPIPAEAGSIEEKNP